MTNSVFSFKYICSMLILIQVHNTMFVGWLKTEVVQQLMLATYGASQMDEYTTAL